MSAEDGAIAANAAAAADVQAALVKRVLPALSEQLIVKNEVNSAFCIARPIVYLGLVARLCALLEPNGASLRPRLRARCAISRTAFTDMQRAYYASQV